MSRVLVGKDLSSWVGKLARSLVLVRTCALSWRAIAGLNLAYDIDDTGRAWLAMC